MKKIVLAVVGVAALGLSACSKAPECTAEVIGKKTQELTTAVQEAVTKNPAKATEWAAKVQEIATKYSSSSNQADACKAYDEIIAEVKKG
ncbi:hypothetical protein [Mesorhizobium retamae]|uniref:Lipoprotein n=1 Tax=Mesorhizobium retamae TaxID=2912854 RepID=A0ABS9Q7Y9_9HYPH|nr:hypothetical protein [Mesorhizobium sp. IRAMC:0171]MCG7503539.1 hypothetical protein [Mesorhizobium sp. IRAMC:0171]